jgi:hypothetical protein
MPKLRVIIGQGAAAEIFRQTVVPGYETIIFGDRGLWAGIRGHKMGQPAHVLTLPGQKMPPVVQAQGTSLPGMAGYMDSNTFQQNLLLLSGSNDVRDGGVSLSNAKVTEVKRENNYLLVVGQTGGGQRLAITADQVIFANGIGPQRPPDFPINGKKDSSCTFEQIQEGIAYITGPASPDGLTSVMVYGGGATSAWAADLALSRSPKHFTWAARAGGTGFSKAMLPGMRNQMILDKTKDNREEITIESITYLDPGSRTKMWGVQRKPKLELKYKTGDAAEPWYRLLDQFVYSIAGNPTAEGSVSRILSQNLYTELEPIQDRDLVLTEGEGILGWGTPARDVLVIGAAAFSNLPKYVDARGTTNAPAPMLSLPWGSQVPDGIGVAVATISALNNYIPIQQVVGADGSVSVSDVNLNMNLADRNQIACYIAVFYPDLEPGRANAAVEEIITVRSQRDQVATVGKNTIDAREHDRAFGITEDEARLIIERYL